MQYLETDILYNEYILEILGKLLVNFE